MDENRKIVMGKLFEVVNMVTGMNAEELDLDDDLFSFGLDSLSLMALGKQIGKKFDIEVSLEDLMTKYNTLNLMGNYLSEIVNLETVEEQPYKIAIVEQAEGKEETVEPTLSANPAYEQNYSFVDEVKKIQSVQGYADENINIVSQLLDKQMSIMQEQTLIMGRLLGNNQSIVSCQEKVPQKQQAKIAASDKKEAEMPAKQTPEKEYGDYYVPYKKTNIQKKTDITKAQSQYIRNFEESYTSLTGNSKHVTSQYRKIHAEWRNASGFSPIYKEFVYPIYAKSGKGSRVTDIDNNKFIDVTMGFGVNLFGNNPDFVQDAIRKAMLENGTPLGPLDQLSCEVAEKISELTGVERVFFANTGTEADMFAVRIARAVTGKNKVVCFKGSYHGGYDGLLGISFWNSDNEVSTIPMAPGITENAVCDLIMLEYDSEKSLQYIEQHADCIAAVVVEPVQSRRPDIQPKEFLTKLRKITEEQEIALIFDEVVLGFRIAAGGAQEYFGIKADIVTYGKVIGGGLPIGVVAGSSRFLDSIDGGQWKYGDDSVPVHSAARTFVGGTFCHNHYTISAANAVLDYILTNKETMYDVLNNRTAYLADSISRFFKEENVPVTIYRFFSMFKFNLNANEDIFYYRLLQKGIYIWEGRTCFLSTEHSEEDVEKIIKAVKETVIELKQAGFFRDENAKKKIVAEKEYPMSLIQQRLYTQILMSGQDPFDMVGVFEVTGELNAERLENALNQVIEQNEILRTSLYMKDGQFLQKIEDQSKVKIRNVVQNQEEELNSYINQILYRFQIDQLPLMEVILLTTYTERKILVFHIHHAVSDGISLEILVQEIVRAYGGARPVQLLPYSKFVTWEKEYMNSERPEADKAFWRQEMEDVTCSIPLPYLKNKSFETNHEGKVLYKLIEKETADKLKQIAKDNEVSMFMLMLGVLDLLLHKMSNVKSVAVAISASLRFVSGFENAMGMYANNIALKSDYDNDMTLKEYLHTIKKGTIKAFSHISFPYNLLVKEVQEQGQGEFNVTFSYEKADQRTPEMDGVMFQPVSFMPDTQDYEVTFDLQEKNNGIEINFSYCKDLFDKRDMKYMLERYLYIAKQIIEKPITTLADLDILLEEEKNLILGEFNDTKMDFPMEETVVSMFEKQVEKTPDNLALWQDERKYTYKELNEMANQVAWHLNEYGVSANDAICLMAQRSVEMIICIHGILKAGAAYMPVDPRYPQERIRYMVNDCRPKLILSGDMRVPEGLGVPVRSIFDETLYTGKCENLNLEIKPDDIVHYMYTSGTTGNPKGVMSTHIGLLNRIIWQQNQYPLKRGDSILQKTTNTFDDSVYEILWSTLFGEKLCILEAGVEMDVEKIYQAIVKYKITQILFVPTVLREFLKYIKEKNVEPDIGGLRLVVSSGEALTPDLTALFKEVLGNTDCVLANLYGPTEASIDVTYYNCQLNETENIPIGKPIGNTLIYILRDTELCGIKMQGELCIGGIGVAKGYLNRRELTGEKFISNPFGDGAVYRTGDIVYWDHDGNIKYCGRKDEQVKIRGQRVELGEIETAVRNLKHVQNVAVIARKDANHVESVYAYMVSEIQLDLKQIREQLRVNLPDYMIPQYMIQIDNIPRASNGKVRKQELPEIKGESFIEYIPPENEVQEILCKIFQEILGVEKVGLQDGFFELGGDSIRAIKIVSKLRDAGYDLAVKEIFTRDSIESIADAVHSSDGRNSLVHAVGKVMPVPMIGEFESFEMNKPQHYNYAVMIPVGNANEVNASEAIIKLVEHHDVLRSQYQEGILTVLEKDAFPVEIKIVDLRNKENAFISMETECNAVQESFDFGRGPLVKAVFFQMDTGNYVMVCVHRLIADEYSMQILTEDYQSIIESIENGIVPELKAKTTSYKEFSESLNQYLNTSTFREDQEQWKMVKTQILEGKLKAAVGNSARSKKEQLVFTLPMSETNSLLQSACMAFHTDVSELMTVALAKACSDVTGQKQVAVDIQDPGRNCWCVLNLDRTVGWVACHYPIIVMVEETLDKMIIQTKEMIRKLPEIKAGAQVVCKEEKSDILLVPLTYDHQFGNGIQTDFPLGNCIAKENDSAYAIEISCSLQNQILNITMLYDEAKMEKEKAEQLKEYFHKQLLEIIHFCIERDEQVKTASDYGSTDIEDAEIKEILGMFD